MAQFELRGNGERRRVDGRADTPLLWVLRDELELTGTKYGCGRSFCGTGTVHLDGQPIRSCVTQVTGVDDAAVTTIEGLSEDGSHPTQRAWEEEDVPQCGYCQAGQIMSAAALLAETPRPTDEEIGRVMRGNLCRCGTYVRIRRAIKREASAAGEEVTDG